jgi:malyl-CoA/(S)-citramalyl-CoA lyase
MTQPERSMLYVPASSRRMIEKAVASDADAVCLDLEDAVAPHEKVAARAAVIRACKELAFGHRRRMFRINGLNTPFAYRDLTEVIEAAGDRIDQVIVPKVGRAEDVVFVDMLVTQIQMSRGDTQRIGVAAQIETADGFLYVREIARSSSRLETLIFGPGDYSASMHMTTSGGEFGTHDETYPGHRWHAVMHAIVASARANGLRCLDGPYAAHKDSLGLERSCRIARALGFDGKQCIHPNQLLTVNTIFTPTSEEVAYAQRIVHAYQEALATGQGVVSLDGKMLDAVNLRLAEEVLRKNQL